LFRRRDKTKQIFCQGIYPVDLNQQLLCQGIPCRIKQQLWTGYKTHPFCQLVIGAVDKPHPGEVSKIVQKALGLSSMGCEKGKKSHVMQLAGTATLVFLRSAILSQKDTMKYS